MEWVSIKKERPIIGIPVWIADNGYVLKCAYYLVCTDDDQWWESLHDSYNMIKFDRITHWMEIVPPKD